MQQNSGFSMAEAAKLLASAEGQQLLALLRRDGGDALSQAAAAMRAGWRRWTRSNLERPDVKHC